MIRNFKHITSLFLVLVLLLPSFVKLEHHHKYFINSSGGERHNQHFSDSCRICNLEFSIFITDGKESGLHYETPSDSYSINYDSRDYSFISQFSFSLRAPPLKQI
jgi:hypothetical protein